jgi:hypothetical protein
VRERCHAFAVGEVDVGSGVDEQPHDLGVAPGHTASVNVGPALEQGAHAIGFSGRAPRRSRRATIVGMSEFYVDEFVPERTSRSGTVWCGSGG